MAKEALTDSVFKNSSNLFSKQVKLLLGPNDDGAVRIVLDLSDVDY